MWVLLLRFSLRRVLGFTDALHQEVLSSQVHVTGVYPGKTHTRFLMRATGGEQKGWVQAMTAEAVAECALKGLSENKVRVIPGWSNLIMVLILRILPIGLLLKIMNKHAIK